MNSKLLRQVYEKAKEGEFAEVVRLIKDIKVETEIANNILINVANACYYDKVSSNIGKDDIYCLLSNMFSSVDKIEETHVVRYLQSVFHIIKYMCDKKWFDHLAEMEFIIVPKFFKDIPLKSIKDGKHAYHALIMKLYNSISVLSGAGEIGHNKYLLRLIKIILKANNKIHSTEETLTMARNLLNIIDELNFQNDELCQFYFIVLEELEADLIKSVDCMEKITILLTNIFSTILSDLIEAKEFEAARMFFTNVESRIRLSLNQQEILIAHILFRAVTCCFPSDTDEDMKDCKAQIASFKLSHEKMFCNIVRFLEEPFNSLLGYYKSFKCKVWCGLPSETVLNFLEFIRKDICSYLIFAQIKCSCGCSLEINYYGMLKIACKLSGLSKYYIDSNKNLSLKFYSEVVQLLNCCYEILKKLKDNNCDKWSQIYRELGTYAYNIGTALFKQENVSFVKVYQCFLRNSLEFDGLSPTILNVKLNEVSFHMICEMEVKNQRTESCMAFAALYCLLYQQKINSVFQNWWIKSKIKLKEDSNIQQLTLVAILENQCKLLSSIVDPPQYLTREKKLELLTYELFCYKTLWKSKESVMAAFSHIVAMSEVPKIAEVLLQIFGDGEMQLHENMPAVFSIAMKKLEYFLKTNSDHYVKVALAVLYYYSYKDSSRKTADQNRSEMERTMLVMESVKEKNEPVPKDPNDECDIVSAYSNLRVNKFIEVLKPLNKCVDIIGSLEKETYLPQIATNISKVLAKIGFEYRLNCFSIKSLQAFEMSMKFAEQISDHDSQLLAISFLIENSVVKKNFVMEMLSKGDKLAKLLEENNLKDKHSKTLAVYQISKAKAFLFEDDNLSYESWKVADVLVTANESKDEFKFLRAELYMLHYKLTKLCNFVAGEHERNPMTFKLHCAMDIVINLSQKNRLSSHELCILFDTVYELAKVYYSMRLPRDLRAYSKNSVLLTQKLVLPMRCASFLILLGHSDLLTCKFDHCNVKLNGINDIFCLSQARPFVFNEKIDDVIESDAKTFENEVDKCASQIQELALDLPQHVKQYSPASPVLMVESFKAPQFLCHDKSCMCFLCLSSEYHRLLLRKYHLDALFNMYEKDETVAEEYVQGALMLYKTLRRKYANYSRKAGNLISESLIFNFDDEFREYYGNVLYDYSSHLMRKSLKSEALKINTELVQLLKPKKQQYVYLYNDALLQRLSYIKSPPKENLIVSQMMNLNLDQKENSSVPRTPVNKRSTVTVTVNGLPKYSPPKRRNRKLCALFASPSDGEDTTKKSPAAISKTNIFAVPKSKSQKGAVSVHDIPKIQIFTDQEPPGSIRKSRRKKPVTSDHQHSSKSVSFSEEDTITKSPVAASKTSVLKNSECDSVAFAVPKTKSQKASVFDTPKIQIFTEQEPPGSIRKSRRKKHLTSDNQSVSDSKRTATPRNVRKTLNSAMLVDETIEGSKETCDATGTPQQPILAESSKTRGQLLTQKIKDSSLKNKTGSATLTNVPVNSKNISPHMDESETSSIIPGTPEREIASVKSVKRTAKNTERIGAQPEVKQNVFQKIKDSSLENKTGSATLTNVPVNSENISPNMDESETSSIIPGTPEREIATVKSVKRTAKKTGRIGAQSEAKKNLLGDFLESETNSSKCTKETGAIRKSARNRVL